MDDIISEWNSELERRSRAFVRHAEALAEWDKHILRNRHALLGLEQQLKQVMAGQDALERKLSLVEMHQKGIHDTLVSMEGEAERLYKEERALLDDDARERDRLYERAEKVGGLLVKLGEQLKEAIADVNESTAATLGDSSTPLSKVVRILNNQLQALTQVDNRTEELSAKLAALQGPSGAARQIAGPPGNGPYFSSQQQGR